MTQAMIQRPDNTAASKPGRLTALRQGIREVGLWATAIYALSKALQVLRWGRAVHYEILAVDLRQIQAPPASKNVSEQRFMRLKRDDPFFSGIDAAQDEIARRLGQGSLCSALIKKDQAVAWIWHHQGAFDEDEVRARFALPGDAVWDFGVFIPVAARGGRTLLHLWQHYAVAVSQEGKNWSVSRIGVHNRSSLRAHKRLPHRSLGHCSFIQLGRFQLSVSTLSPRVSFCSSRDDAPVFDIADPL